MSNLNLISNFNVLQSAGSVTGASFSSLANTTFNVNLNPTPWSGTGFTMGSVHPTSTILSHTPQIGSANLFDLNLPNPSQMIPQVTQPDDQPFNIDLPAIKDFFSNMDAATAAGVGAFALMLGGAAVLGSFALYMRSRSKNSDSDIETEIRKRQQGGAKPPAINIPIPGPDDPTAMFPSDLRQSQDPDGASRMVTSVSGISEPALPDFLTGQIKSPRAQSSAPAPDGLGIGTAQSKIAEIERQPNPESTRQELVEKLNSLVWVAGADASTPVPPQQSISVVDLSHGGVIEDYKIIRKIGEGGMGTVYEAIDPSLKRRVALKVVRRDKITIEQFNERFQREAEAAANIDCPNVAQVLKFGKTQQGQLYMTSRFYPGGTLSQLVSRFRDAGQLIPEALAAFIARDIANALIHIEESKIIHRDIKPANILLNRVITPDNYPRTEADFAKYKAVVTDFGLVKPLETGHTLTASDMLLGTPVFMSPEQMEGKDLDIRTDIFATAATLFYLLTMKKPYPAMKNNTPAEFLRLLNRKLGLEVDGKKSTLPLPSHIRPNVNPDFDSMSQFDLIMVSGLAADLRVRYENAQKFYDELDVLFKRILEQR